MKILNVEWKAFGNEDIKDAFRLEGHKVVGFPLTKEEDPRHNPEAEKRLSSVLHRETPDVVFSFNYFPFISKVCNKENGLMQAQMKVQGYNFIQECLNPVMEDLYKALPLDPNEDGVESREFLYSQYVINRKITGLERTALLHAITRKHTFDLFTFNDDFVMDNLRNHGQVAPYDEMPRVFKQSRINLNITLRSIKSGIPLRGFDILGSGGFLLSNFQADFLDFFVPGEDYVYYESEGDLLQKIDYYMKNDKEREEIARNGHDKVAAGHTYRHRVREMLDFCV